MALPGRMTDVPAGGLWAERLVAPLPVGRPAEHIVKLLGGVVMRGVEASGCLQEETKAQQSRPDPSVRPDDLVIGGAPGEACRHLRPADNPGNLRGGCAQRPRK